MLVYGGGRGFLRDVASTGSFERMQHMIRWDMQGCSVFKCVVFKCVVFKCLSV